jgi:hypothetical protein
MNKYLINYAAKGANWASNTPNDGYFNAQKIDFAFPTRTVHLHS